jgi:tetratricopeptide (TPR) repeat protein
MFRWPNPKNFTRSRLKAARLAAARARHKPSDTTRTAWEVAELYWARFVTLTKNGVGILAAGFALYIAWESVTRKVISIAPISVPKVLATNGYTSDVAAQRLQSALNDIVKVAHSVKKGGPDVAMQADLPGIVVPSTGVSIEVLASYIRSFFRNESRWNVSGEITIVEKKLWLHLRMNGRDLYATAAGGDPEHPDALFGQAAQKVLEKTNPYILAASLSKIDPIRSLEIAKRLISDRPVRDPSVSLAHNLIGLILRDQGKIDGAIAEYRKATELDPDFGLAHRNLGLALGNQKKYGEAIAECQKAIKLDPHPEGAHAAMCNLLSDMHTFDAANIECDTAINEYRKIIKLDPYEGTPQVKLGLLLRRLGRTDEAIEEFRWALELNPRDALTHIDLGLDLLKQKKTDEAIIEFQKAIEIDPSLAIAHRSLSDALTQQGKNEAANAELDKALALERNR